jgi:hypothetical protein
MMTKLSCITLFIAIAAVMAACTSPQAAPERDADAKQFSTHPNAAALYVFRSNFNRQVQMDDDSVLYLDDRLIGNTLPGAYFRIDAVPGRHILHGIGADAGRLSMDVRAGELYFVRLDVVNGQSHFRIEPEQVGRAQVKACCALLENWTPGQRPLLR